MYIMREDIYTACYTFFDHTKLLKSLNCIAICLVLKVPNPSHVRDFRPISCANVLYKVIAKVLSSRLQRVTPKLVSLAQSDFVSGRQILDSILLASELVKAYSYHHVSSRCMIKINLRKAYDYVEWPFVEHMLSSLGFP